jgi:hypothetical protein
MAAGNVTAVHKACKTLAGYLAEMEHDPELELSELDGTHGSCCQLKGGFVCFALASRSVERTAQVVVLSLVAQKGVPDSVVLPYCSELPLSLVSLVELYLGKQMVDASLLKLW